MSVAPENPLPDPKEADAENSPPESMTQALGGALFSLIWILRLALLLLLGIYLSSGITFVPPGENALVLRFGRLLPDVHPPGLLLAWPSPIDRVVRVPGGQVLELDIEEWEPAPASGFPGEPIPRAAFHPANHGYTLTGDRNILQGLFTLRYRVVDPAAYALGFFHAEAALRQLTLQALTRVLATMRVDAALIEDRQILALTARDAAQAAADDIGLGVELTALEIRELVPPVWVASAFQEVVNARVEADTVIQEALDERAQRLPEATASAYRLRAEATARKRDRLLQARAEAVSFAEVRLAAEENPALFQARRHSETLALVLPRLRSTTILAPQTPPAGLWLRPQSVLRLPVLPLTGNPTGTSLLPSLTSSAVNPPSRLSPADDYPTETVTVLEALSGDFEAWENLPLPSWDSREEP